jgi:hypothetical protein
MTRAAAMIFQLASCFLGYLVFRYVLYPVFASPLRRIPNAHVTSPLSPIWILWIRATRRENRTIHAAHQRLGPIVRLGPSEISVACVDQGIRSIYPGGFEKHEWYRFFDNFG